MGEKCQGNKKAATGVNCAAVPGRLLWDVVSRVALLQSITNKVLVLFRQGVKALSRIGIEWRPQETEITEL
jgi:hypothetical protein